MPHLPRGIGVRASPTLTHPASCILTLPGTLWTADSVLYFHSVVFLRLAISEEGRGAGEGRGGPVFCLKKQDYNVCVAEGGGRSVSSAPFTCAGLLAPVHIMK